MLTHWNGYELLGIKNKPAGTDFDVEPGLPEQARLRLRRLVHTTTATACSASPATRPAWPISGASKTTGVDDLGQDRGAVPPEASYRYRLFWQHREMLPYDLQLSAELGWISDRNFLEEYYKSEWDTLKDETHRRGAETRHRTTVPGASRPTYRVNDFFTADRTGCRGPTISGWANRCSATRSPGTSTPAPATPSSGN